MIVNGVSISNDMQIPSSIGGYPLNLLTSDEKTHSYDIIFDEYGTAIQVKSFKDMVGVMLMGSKTAWSDSIGLMGNALTGEKLARDERLLWKTTMPLGRNGKFL